MCDENDDLPDAFITLLSGTMRVRRYSRSVGLSWDVHDWCGEWEFYDNVGVETAGAAYDSATIVAEEIER